MQLDPTKTAVVLIEFQNDFATEGGSLHGAVQGVMEQTNMLANAQVNDGGKVRAAAQRSSMRRSRSPMTIGSWATSTAF